MPSPDSLRTQPTQNNRQINPNPNNSPSHHHSLLIPISSSPPCLSSSSSHSLAFNPSDIVPYSDTPPARPILRQPTSTQQNQRDQDVQAALHFSRARSGTLASIHNSSRPQTEPAWPAHHDLLSGPPHTPALAAHLSPSLARPPTARSADSQRDQDVLFFASPVPLGPSPAHSPSHPLLLDLAPDEPLSPRRRRGSDHSLDSAHGAFIDHRTPPLNQPHTLPASAPLHRHRHSLQPSPTNTRQALSASAGPSTRLAGLPEPHHSTHESSFDHPRFPHSGHPEPERLSPLCSSPPPPDLEADVCFPRHDPGRACASPPRAAADGPRRGLAGMLPHFPFPFDFGALEEFKEKEQREALEGGGSARAKGTEQPEWEGQEDGPVGLVEEEEARDGVRRRRIGFLGPSDERAAGRMGILKQRRLSESVAPPGSRQRKLALFEGASGPGGPVESGGGLKGAIEARAPLLGKLARAPSAGPAQRDRAGQVRWGAGSERPYRFSFYSNALPSTIHARSLAEIPSEGQTFEELFVGHSVAGGGVSEEVSEAGQVPSPLPSRAEGLLGTTHLGPGFGRGMEAGHSHGNGNGNGSNGKPRSGVLMRTDEDAEANTWWLDVLCPTDSEMKLLSKVFGIHPLTTEDIQMEETREKIELFRNYYLVCFRSFDQDVYSPTYLEPLNMYIVVFREGTLSFHFRGTPHPQNVRRRIKQLKDYINVTSDWISYALIDDITDAFGPLIKSIEYEVDSIDELVLILKEAEQSDMLRRIGTCRKKVMGLLRLMGNKADVVKGLSKRCNENWSVAPKSDIGLYLSDIQDHLVTMTQNLNHYEKILSRSHSNYLAQISIEMTDANNQINDVLSKLTALGSILVPMNLVTGLWGMNVHVPGQDITEGYAWFIAIVCGLVTFGVVGAWLTLRYFKFSNSG